MAVESTMAVCMAVTDEDVAMARETKAWTDKGLRSLKPDTKTYEQHFTGMRGLHCQVFPNGKKTLRFQYYEDGKRYRMILGHFPDQSLEELSDLYILAKAERVKKVNIVEQRKIEKLEEENRQRIAELEKQAEDSRLTFNKLANLYIDEYAVINKKSWKEDKRILERNILPTFGDRAVEDIARPEYRSLLNDIDAPIMANRVLACLRGVLNWAVAEEYIEVNRVARMKRPSGKEKGKERALSLSEIKEFWKMCADIPNPLHCAILRLVLLTGQRPSEVSQAKWSEFKKDWWTLPAERSKNGKEHRIYLVPQAREVLDGIPKECDYLFPQKLGRKTIRVLNKPLDKGTPAHVLLGAVRLNKLEPFTVHDLRRTMATQLGDMGYMDDQIGLVLNHVRAGVTQRYNKSSHDKPKKEMMMAWSAKFDEIMKGKKAAKVVKLA